MATGDSFASSLGITEIEHRFPPDLLTAFRDILPRCCMNDVDEFVPPGILGEGITPVLPSRVLDVGDHQDLTSYHSVHLHVRTQDERGTYVALSHRWGLRGSQKMPLQTTRRNLKQHCKGISYKCLPSTFRDAITVTRMLGIRYLWIDALCILQDDQDDWLKQSSQMGSIFKNSLLTIAVHSAKNSSEGFLWRRHIPEFLRIQPRKRRSGEPSSFYIRVPMLSDFALKGSLQDSQISHRAWVLQELSLSPHILHFVEDRMVWDCSHQRVAIGEQPTRTPASIMRSAASDSSRQWLRMIELYSSCEMTKSCDKLPAIAGIANVWPTLHANPQADAYHYGIFGSDVCNSLLWLNEDKCVVRVPRRAPSWSWASVDGGVEFILLYYSNTTIQSTSDIQVISFNHRERRNGEGRLMGELGPMQLWATMKDGLEIGTVWKSSKFPFCPMDRPRYICVIRYQSTRVGWASFDEDCSKNPIKTSNIRFMRILTRGTGQIRRCYVLIVEQSQYRADEYKRVGMGCIFEVELFDHLKSELVYLY